ncbi:hypothetical protein Gasu2_04950 [Galdieria sulphuraria]|uniref:Uncharacterized protein n=1 Tax=Galdieria sulphuraria TaxID=130081 RepID=M2W9A1_GALSU|nr:uncharacterized protein Gasu_05290 [Galdieria sulphuraria]EME32446.1 hypothetical protein Gasu_05290 [Galdieria sulphuraria]GJD06057.1 hypothetical protein Gasu2_04950 [Galdieria sulphuraria]|eukprot:XP_005708966.1 hypothetical protein Gasu_05290 [Galdieria sulphuraria]
MASQYPVSGSGQFTHSSYGDIRSPLRRAPGSLSRKERVEGVEWAGVRKPRDGSTGKFSSNTPPVLQTQRRSGNYLTLEQPTVDLSTLQRNFADGSTECYISEEGPNIRTNREFNTFAPRKSDRSQERGGESLHRTLKSGFVTQQEDVVQPYSNVAAALKQSSEAHQSSVNFSQKNAAYNRAASYRNANLDNFAPGVNNNCVKPLGRKPFVREGGPAQMGPRSKQELDFHSGFLSSGYSRERVEERLDGTPSRPDLYRNLWKAGSSTRGAGEASSQFSGARNENQQQMGYSNFNLADLRNFSSPQPQNSTITANTSSLYSLDPYPQNQDQLRFAMHGVTSGQKPSPYMSRITPNNINHATSDRIPTQSHVLLHQKENYHMNQTLLRYIEEFRHCLDIIREVDVGIPEIQFLLEIGSVIERALGEVIATRSNRFEVGSPYLEMLVKFIDVFLNYASCSARTGMFSIINQQRFEQTNSQVDTNTRTSTTNTRVGGMSTPGFSFEGSQTNESSIARINSNGAIYTDTEPSQHSQYSARSHRSATIHDSLQNSGTMERNKVRNKTKGAKRSAPEQSSEDFEAQSAGIKSARPPSVRTDIIDQPVVSNSVSSSEIERSTSNTFSKSKTGKESLNSQGEEDIVLKTKEQLDISTASLRRNTEHAELFLNKLKERNLQLLRFSRLIGRRGRHTDISGTRSHPEAPEDSFRNTVEIIKLECENLKHFCRGLDVYICETDSCILVKCKISGVPFRLPHLYIKLNSEDPDNLYGHSFDYCGIELGDLGARVKEEFTKALKKYSQYINIITLIRVYWKIVTEVTSSLMTDYRK